MNNLTLSHIFIYPIKSLGGISLQSAKVEERGLQYDRRWMLVDKNGMFLTQREYPQMALLQVKIKDDKLEVAHKIKTVSSLQLPISKEQTPGSHGRTMTEKTSVKESSLTAKSEANHIVVNIWNDVVIAKNIYKDADAWFSEALNLNCHLVFMDKDADRHTDTKYYPEPTQVSFADAYPFLLIGQESLNELNRRLKDPLPMNRFRPNFVFSGGGPFIEDTWKDFMIGDLKFRAVKPCARCVVTTVNQDTAEKESEPLETLAKFRKVGNKVMFGQNVIGYDEGVVRVGDRVEPLDT
ncbi:MAG: oxidoreductase [Ignavibacteria bacterium RBG_16_35_7]|nr:MAG: oxidoreductase [Ignavibacteria bacterium RBG_16_35_7]